MVFPVRESWSVKKPELQITETFKLWCRRRFLRDPWIARGSNQSILKEINPEFSLEGLMMKLMLQYFGQLMWRADSLEKTLIWESLRAGGVGDDRGWDGWLASPTQWTWVWVNSGGGEGQGGQACCGSWGCKESDMTEWLNWTESFSTALHLVFPSDWQEGKRPSLNLLPWRVLMTFCPSLIRRFGSKLMKPFHPIWSLQPPSIKSLLLPWET